MFDSEDEPEVQESRLTLDERRIKPYIGCQIDNRDEWLEALLDSTRMTLQFFTCVDKQKSNIAADCKYAFFMESGIEASEWHSHQPWSFKVMIMDMGPDDINPFIELLREAVAKFQ